MSRGAVLREAQPLVGISGSLEGTDDLDAQPTELVWKAPQARAGTCAESASRAFAAADKVLLYDVCSESNRRPCRRSSTHTELLDTACLSFSQTLLYMTGVDINCCSQSHSEDIQYVENITSIDSVYANSYVKRSAEAQPGFSPTSREPFSRSAAPERRIGAYHGEGL